MPCTLWPNVLLHLKLNKTTGLSYFYRAVNDLAFVSNSCWSRNPCCQRLVDTAVCPLQSNCVLRSQILRSSDVTRDIVFGGFRQNEKCEPTLPKLSGLFARTGLCVGSRIGMSCWRLCLTAVVTFVRYVPKPKVAKVAGKSAMFSSERKKSLQNRCNFPKRCLPLRHWERSVLATVGVPSKFSGMRLCSSPPRNPPAVDHI